VRGRYAQGIVSAAFATAGLLAFGGASIASAADASLGVTTQAVAPVATPTGAADGAADGAAAVATAGASQVASAAARDAGTASRAPARTAAAARDAGTASRAPARTAAAVRHVRAANKAIHAGASTVRGVTRSSGSRPDAAATAVRGAAKPTHSQGDAASASVYAAAKTLERPVPPAASDATRLVGAIVRDATRTFPPAPLLPLAPLLPSAPLLPLAPLAPVDDGGAPSAMFAPHQAVEGFHPWWSSPHPHTAPGATTKQAALTSRRAGGPMGSLQATAGGEAPAVASPSGARRAGSAAPPLRSPSTPMHTGAPVAGAGASTAAGGIAVLALLTFILAAPATRRRLLAFMPAAWTAAPVFLLDRPG
jgi:hypothetical protein